MHNSFQLNPRWLFGQWHRSGVAKPLLENRSMPFMDHTAQLLRQCQRYSIMPLVLCPTLSRDMSDTPPHLALMR